MHTVKLPAKHAYDWWSRCSSDEMISEGSHVVDHTERTITFELGTVALADLVSDSKFYAECMGPEDTGDIDYRPAARRCLAKLEKLGLL